MEEDHGHVGVSSCYDLLEAPASRSVAMAALHQMEFEQQEGCSQGLGFIFPPHGVPFASSNTATTSQITMNDKVNGSDLKVGHHQISSCKDGSISWWKSSSSEKGKMKVRRNMREPRFCFQTISDVDVLDDGYKWRKYGQKVVKNSLHPRSYYRCTHNSCRVKKRIERLSENCRMVMTTYEGRHSHSPPHETTSCSDNHCFNTF